MKTRTLVLASMISLFLTSLPVQAAKDIRQQLNELADNPQRGAAHLQRNQYRNPVDTLLFFGVEPQMSVLELWPVRGWYTEILAPFLKDHGQLTIANFRQDVAGNEQNRLQFWARLSQRLQQRIIENEAFFGPVKQVALDPPNFIPQLPTQSFDMILSFRNAHIWDQTGHLQATLAQLFDALKPGGTLGMVEHRAAALTDVTSVAVEGYIDEAYLIRVAEQVGFTFVASSEINANPRDTKDHPKGVYTLPPTLALGLERREHYLAIGESDRMTLKFSKPET